MATTRCQSQALSAPQPAVALQEPDNPTSTPSQESSGSTPSQARSGCIPSQGSPESPPSQDSPLSPGWVHAITIIMGYTLKSDEGQKLQKCVLYHLIDDPTNF